MASERALKLAVAAGAAGLAALGAGVHAAWGSPRLLLLCGLGALASAAMLWSGLARLKLPKAVPEASPEPAGRQALIDGALVTEARLEHAPIALFRIEPAGDAAAALVFPLNANARHLVAPGRASDPRQLYRQLAQQPADRRGLVGFETERGLERALVSVSALTLQGSAQRVAALMPVESELEAEALNAWRQLVQVLTHEIMNSLTPVASLSRTAAELLGELRGGLPEDAAADLGTALDAIGRRAASLIEFVASYRSLSGVPEARPERIVLASLFARLAALLGPAWQARGGRADFSVEPASLEVMADPGQLEQALINLLTNAAEATAQTAAPAVTVQARLGRGGRLRIEVVDNGSGVPEELAAHIFTPFFSTRKRERAEGRGIGLALVRHLVHANGGTVRYARSVAAGARFVVTF